MSYTTLNRYCEPTHTYAPSRQASFVRGNWWVDFGPSSYDYSYQPKDHPTETIHNSVFESKVAFRGQRAGTIPPGNLFKTLSNPDLAFKESAAASPQFRRPQPEKDALFSSTIIQPYKSGGHANADKESSNYVKAATADPPTLRAAATMHQTVTLERSMVSPLRRSASTGSTLAPALNNGEPAPRWLATQTIVSRPQDAAGIAGSTRLKFHAGSSQAARHAPEPPEKTAMLASGMSGAASLSLRRSPKGHLAGKAGLGGLLSPD